MCHFLGTVVIVYDFMMMLGSQKTVINCGFSILSFCDEFGFINQFISKLSLVNFQYVEEVLAL